MNNKAIFFGTRKSDNKRIYLYNPSWDCNRYWGFGYLGNTKEHYHLRDYQNGRNINMHSALTTDYTLNKNIEKELWTFCELCETCYVLKKSAEVLGMGGSHYTKNPCEDIIKNEAEVKRINEVVLPAIFEELNKICKGLKNEKNNTRFSKCIS